MQADKEENDDLITELQHELLTLKDKKNLHEDWEDWATNEKQPSIKSAITSSINVVPDPNSNPCGAPKETQTQAKLAKELNDKRQANSQFFQSMTVGNFLYK